eukprot:TRINITY_DN7319_c0_g1_i1.p1 TRINITY_DN7319_c0_g1~~TRINITY_DN7319_c0_g1_i1.p1  ORF type:complete len:267 (-),score=17.28 TRINITY_DN7319_c0_g1_i1:3-803(-)
MSVNDPILELRGLSRRKHDKRKSTIPVLVKAQSTTSKTKLGVDYISEKHRRSSSPSTIEHDLDFSKTQEFIKKVKSKLENLKQSKTRCEENIEFAKLRVKKLVKQQSSKHTKRNTCTECLSIGIFCYDSKREKHRYSSSDYNQCLFCEKQLESDSESESNYLTNVLSKANLLLDKLTNELSAYNKQINIVRNSLIKLKEEIENTDSALKTDSGVSLCKICYNDQISAALVPCGHIYCANCTQKICRENVCPICRSSINKKIEIFFP